MADTIKVPLTGEVGGGWELSGATYRKDSVLPLLLLTLRHPYTGRTSGVRIDLGKRIILDRPESVTDETWDALRDMAGDITDKILAALPTLPPE
jgi:hypothetical protein